MSMGHAHHCAVLCLIPALDHGARAKKKKKEQRTTTATKLIKKKEKWTVAGTLARMIPHYVTFFFPLLFFNLFISKLAGWRSLLSEGGAFGVANETESQHKSNVFIKKKVKPSFRAAPAADF